MGGVPDRWMEYSPMGTVIPGTRFIAFKVPLKEALCRNLRKNKWFTPKHIIDDNPNISLIVDLTNTTRYYDSNIFQNANKSYVKIFCPGHVVPTGNIISQFFESVDKFLSEHPNDGTLIGVHCTHGVNRTGYFICKYMIDKLGIDPDLAIEDVGRARGYPIERINYLEDLKGGKITKSPSPNQQQEPPRLNRAEPSPVKRFRSEHYENWRDPVERSRDEARRSTFNERSSNYVRGPHNRHGSYRQNSSYLAGSSYNQPNSYDQGRNESRSDRYKTEQGSRYGRQGGSFQGSPGRFRGNFSRDNSQDSYRNHPYGRPNPDDRSRSRTRKDERPNRGRR